jgi:hypothetical protein
MSDDREDEAAKPHPSAAAPESAPPLVQNDELTSGTVTPTVLEVSHGLMRTESAAALAGEGRFAADVTVIGGKMVRYVDFGFTSAEEFWTEVVLPAYECFKAEPTRGKAIMACFPAWHIQDWIWHQQHPGEDTHNNNDYRQFQHQLYANCPELQWIRDVADAGKHRGLGRQSVEVREVKSAWALNATPLTMTLGDGTQHAFADVLDCVIQFWRAKYFP